jgi:hypothetical protein
MRTGQTAAMPQWIKQLFATKWMFQKSGKLQSRKVETTAAY